MVSRVSTVVVETQKPYAKCIACDVDKVQGKYFKTPLKWANIVFITLAHLLTLWALLTFPYFYKLKTFFYGEFFFILCQIFIHIYLRDYNRL